jgi:hypothetical protein
MPLAGVSDLMEQYTMYYSANGLWSSDANLIFLFASEMPAKNSMGTFDSTHL